MVAMLLDCRGAVRWDKLALAFWLLILAGIGIRVGLHPASRSTYPIYSASVRLWWDGGELYFPHRPESVQGGFRYAPTFAILAAPFGLLSDDYGGILWRYANAAALLTALAWWG